MRHITPRAGALHLRRLAWTGLLCITLGACSVDEECTLEPRPGLILEIRDSISNAAAAAGSIAVAAEGPYVDSVNVTSSLTASLAGNRGGNYAVRVRKSGYQLWERVNIFVPGGECGPDEPVQLLLRLQSI